MDRDREIREAFDDLGLAIWRAILLAMLVGFGIAGVAMW